MQRQFVLVLAAAVSIAALAAASAPARAPRAHAASSYTVRLLDSRFSPSSITARGKATLSFVYAGKLTHNIIGKNIPESYATPHRRKKTLTRTYSRGSYTFICSIHDGMTLRLRVK